MSPTRQCRAEGHRFDPFWRFNHTSLNRLGVFDNSGIRHYQDLPVYCDFASVAFRKCTENNLQIIIGFLSNPFRCIQ